MPLLEDILGRIHVEGQLLRLLFHSLMESKLLLFVEICLEYCNYCIDFVNRNEISLLLYAYIKWTRVTETRGLNIICHFFLPFNLVSII
jgi:hypothetical protein